MKRLTIILAALALGACTNMTGPDCGPVQEVPMTPVGDQPHGPAPEVTMQVCISHGPMIPPLR